jgi:hypothetical protein
MVVLGNSRGHCGASTDQEDHPESKGDLECAAAIGLSRAFTSDDASAGTVIG